MKWFGKKQAPFKAILPGNETSPVLDEHSDTWKFVKAFVENEIISLRERNDKLTLDAGATAAIRGQIKMAKRILELTGPGDKARSDSFATRIFGAERRNND